MYVKPNLSTIQQSMYAIGQSACEMLFDKLENRRIYQPRLEIGMRLVIRESCGASA
jgi:DNA-binding LacI/PurR family transcriptional regulator